MLVEPRRVGTRRRRRESEEAFPIAGEIPGRRDQTVVGVFERRRPAVACLKALLRDGFSRDQLGFAGPGVAAAAPLEGEETQSEGALAATATGSLAGGVVGGVLGGVVAALIPGLGPIVAGGVLAGLAAGAPAGAAIGALASVLRDAGLSPRVADFYEGQVHAGRFLVTVSSGDPERAAAAIERCGGRVEGALSRTVSQLTDTAPEVVEGDFADPEFAAHAAHRLGEAFPDRRVILDRDGERVRVAVRRRRPAG